MRSSNFLSQRLVLAALGLSVGWLATASADEMGGQHAPSRYATSPLTGALSEASAQSGIAVPRMEGALVPAVTERSAAGSPTAFPGAMAGVSRTLPDPAVAMPPPPAAADWAGDSLYQFIVHHATVHYVNTGVKGNLAHWRGGRPETLCPAALGLDPASNAFVTARIRAVAAAVGAPVQTDSACQDNVRILFTTEPEKLMGDVVKWASAYFGVRYPSMRRLMMYRSGHAIQGWYFTTRGGGRVLNVDVAMLGGVQVLPLWPQVMPTDMSDDGGMSGIVSVILVVDPSQLAGYDFGTIADYLSVLALSVVQSPNHCDPLPSILDLMASSCGTRERPVAITAGDLAFLKGLYYRTSGLGSSLSRIEIETVMRHQFEGQ